jgi:hypothetical protein
MNLTRNIIGISLGVLLFSGAGLAAEPAEVEKFVKARVDIGEMMSNYFQGGGMFKEGQRPSGVSKAQSGGLRR